MLITTLRTDSRTVLTTTIDTIACFQLVEYLLGYWNTFHTLLKIRLFLCFRAFKLRRDVERRLCVQKCAGPFGRTTSVREKVAVWLRGLDPGNLPETFPFTSCGMLDYSKSRVSLLKKVWVQKGGYTTIFCKVYYIPLLATPITQPL